MAGVVPFHHALGLAPGITVSAEELRRAGHTPDLCAGRTFDTTEEGVAHAEDGELFPYPSDQHLIADSALPSFDPDVARLGQRVVDSLRAL